MVNPVQTNHRVKRAKQTAEVFTPNWLVCEMLSKLPQEVWRSNKTFCDPSVGNGQFLIWILLWKIHLGHDPVESLGALYGVDIMRDNVNECRLRLLKIMYQCLGKITDEHIAIVLTNIRCVDDAKIYPNGSLDYDFAFDYTPRPEEIKNWRNWIYNPKGVGILHKFSPVTGKKHVSVPSLEEIRKMFSLLKGIK